MWTKLPPREDGAARNFCTADNEVAGISTNVVGDAFSYNLGFESVNQPEVSGVTRGVRREAAVTTCSRNLAQFANLLRREDPPRRPPTQECRCLPP